MAGLERLNEIRLVDYLSALGYQPFSIDNDKYRYSSPLKKEHFPTFIVDIKDNTWTQGPNDSKHSVLEFAAAYHPFTIRELANHVSDLVKEKSSCQYPYLKADEIELDPLSVISQSSLRSIALLHFLEQRKIPWLIAAEFCSQFEIGLGRTGKKVLAFPNKLGGLELRGPGFAGFYGTRAASFIDRQAPQCAVFLDFVDFLSYQGLYSRQPRVPTDFIVLHSSGFLPDVLIDLDKYKNINLYLPRSSSGKSLATNLCLSHPNAEDRSALYKGHVTLSSWMADMGKGFGRDRPDPPARQLKRSG